MSKLKLLLTLALAGGTLYTSVPSTAAARSTPTAPNPTSQLDESPQLWGTVDVCNATDHPHTIGFRGSMPGDGHPHDTMYMRFRVQYVDPTSKKWAYLSKNGDSGYLKIGAASTARQSGRSFELFPVAGQPSFTLRGLINFQWRRGSKVVYTTSRLTVGGHKSAVGSDPKGFSAASCALT